MKSMNCQVIRRKIEEAELDQYLGDEADAHLRACESCEDFQRERAALRQLVGSLGMVSAPADFDFRLRARLSASDSTRRPGLFRFLPAPGAPAIALAASFAVLIAAVLAFKQDQLPVPGAQPQRVELAALASAPSSTAPAPQAVTNVSKASTEKMDQPPNAALTLKNAESGPKILTAEAKPRNRLNRVLRPTDERLVPAATNAANAVAVGPKNNSLEFSSRPAPVISLVAVQVPTTSQAMRVSLEDRRGATRTVSLQPVTFGSQELIERKGASRVLASSPKGIW